MFASTSQNETTVELKKIIKDCGISHTTLEEVFMKVTGKKISKYVPKDGKNGKISNTAYVTPVHNSHVFDDEEEKDD